MSTSILNGRWFLYPINRQVHSLEHNHDAPGVVPATAAELSHIGELEDTIKTLAQKNVRPAEVYKFCAPEGKALSHDAKQKVGGDW